MITKKSLFVDAVLRLCEQKTLEQITISDLLKETGFSRQTFYNYFQDKQELIVYTYTSRIRKIWEETCRRTNMHNGCEAFFESMLQYKTFMRQALSIKSQNCLADHLTEIIIPFYEEQYQLLYGTKMTHDFQMAVYYNIYGMTGLNIEWAVSGMTIPPSKMAEYVMTCAPPLIREFLAQMDTYYTQQRSEPI